MKIFANRMEYINSIQHGINHLLFNFFLHLGNVVLSRGSFWFLVQGKKQPIEIKQMVNRIKTLYGQHHKRQDGSKYFGIFLF